MFQNTQMYEHNKITNPSHKEIMNWLTSNDYEDIENETLGN